jgi:RNA polymerase sigma-70 factor (ECF subfamily)
MLDTTEVSVTSALQRARATLESAAPVRRERAPLPRSAHDRELVASFADAFEAGDLDRVLGLLTDDAWVTMPPEPFEYQGHDAIAAFLSHAFAARWQERHRLVPTRANGQPAFGHYIPDPLTGVVHGVGVLVLTLEGGRIAQLTRFGGAALLASFGLPRTLPA